MSLSISYRLILGSVHHPTLNVLVKLGPYVSGKYPKATAVCVPEVFALEYAPLCENSVGDQSPTATIGSVKSQISSFGVEFECSEVMRSSDQL